MEHMDHEHMQQKTGKTEPKAGANKQPDMEHEHHHHHE
jgi:hypothetical protein